MQVKIKQQEITSRIRTIEVPDGATTEEIQTIIENYGYDDEFEDVEEDGVSVKTEGFATYGEEDDIEDAPDDLETWVDFELSQYEG